MAPTTPAYRMADQLMDGKLADRISALRLEGLSWDSISRQLYDEAKVIASGATIQSWAKTLGIEVAA